MNSPIEHLGAHTASIERPLLLSLSICPPCILGNDGREPRSLAIPRLWKTPSTAEVGGKTGREARQSESSDRVPTRGITSW